MPADPTVGIGRSAEELKEIRENLNILVRKFGYDDQLEANQDNDNYSSSNDNSEILDAINNNSRDDNSNSEQEEVVEEVQSASTEENEKDDGSVELNERNLSNTSQEKILEDNNNINKKKMI